MCIFKYIILLWCVTLSISCKQDKEISSNPVTIQKNKFKKTKSNNGFILDTIYTYYKLVNSDSLSGIQTMCKIDANEFILVDKILNDAVAEYNLKEKKYWKEYFKKHPKDKINIENFLIDLKKYDLRYSSYLTENGEKRVCVICVCDGYFGLVADGGKCYFSTTINLTTKTHNGITTHSLG